MREDSEGQCLAMETLREMGRAGRAQRACLVALSGGKDSAYVLMQASGEWALDAVPMLVDTGYLSKRAIPNARRVCDRLGLELLIHHIDLDATYHTAMHAVSDGAEPVDAFCGRCHGMILGALIGLAKARGIPRVLTGLSPDLASEVGTIPSRTMIDGVCLESPLMWDISTPRSRRRALKAAGVLSAHASNPMRTNCRWCPYIIAAGLKRDGRLPYQESFDGHPIARRLARTLKCVPLRWLIPRKAKS